MFQMWIRGILCNVDGCVDRADWSVGITSDYFIAETIVRADNGEDMPELTDSEQEAISDAYFDSLPFDPDNHWTHDYREYLAMLETKHNGWLNYWIPYQPRERKVWEN